MEVAGPVEPCLIVLTGDVDHERIAFPVPIRPAHPTLGGSLCRSLHVDDANSARVLVRNHDHVLRLDDLEGIREIGGARHTRQVTFHLWVQHHPAGLVLFLFGRRLWKIWDLIALDNTQPRRCCEYRSERGHRPRPSRVPLEIPIRGVEGLPDAVQVWFAARSPRRPVGWSLTNR